jgi:hypothetical protein
MTGYSFDELVDYCNAPQPPEGFDVRYLRDIIPEAVKEAINPISENYHGKYNETPEKRLENLLLTITKVLPKGDEKMGKQRVYYMIAGIVQNEMNQSRPIIDLLTSLRKKMGLRSVCNDNSI